MDDVTVTVRFFAAACRAAGAAEELVTVSEGTLLGELVDSLSVRSDELSRVLSRCQFLVDEEAVSNHDVVLRPGCTVDALPPFAGG
nr:MoaD/ThiS family protein [Hoyosella rhizosphaerae]